MAYLSSTSKNLYFILFGELASCSWYREGKSNIVVYKIQWTILLPLIDDKYETAGSSVDLTRAFDVIGNYLLIQKLTMCGVTGIAHNLLKPYLTNRRQTVQVSINSNTCRSTASDIIIGVPQGLALGKMLFLTFINNPPYFISGDRVARVFADDITVV